MGGIDTEGSRYVARAQCLNRIRGVIEFGFAVTGNALRRTETHPSERSPGPTLHTVQAYGAASPASGEAPLP